MFRHHLVGGQHELLDQFVGHVVFRLHDVLHLALRVHHDFRLRNVEVDTALLKPALAQQLAEGEHVLQYRQSRCVFIFHRARFQHCRHLGVGESEFTFDDGIENFVVQHVALEVEFNRRAQGQAFLERFETAQLVRQFERQHGDNTIRGIDTGAALQRFLIERAILRNIMADVGDMHAEAVTAAGGLQRHRVVEILGAFAVDGANHVSGQIPSRPVFPAGGGVTDIR